MKHAVIKYFLIKKLNLINVSPEPCTATFKMEDWYIRCPQSHGSAPFARKGLGGDTRKALRARKFLFQFSLF